MIFSIIVSCATGEQTKDLPFLVDSLLAQYDADPKNYEVIFVVDNSIPENIKVVEEQIARFPDKNARILSQGHAGVSAARNLGILNAKGDWLIFATASDFFDQHFVSELAHAIYLYQGIGMFFTRIQSYDPQNPSHHKAYHDLEGSAPKNIIENDLDDNKIFDLSAVNKLQRSARRIAFNRKLCLEQHVFFREDVLFGSEKIFHFTYLYALKKLVDAGDPRFHLGFRSVYVKGAIFHTLPPALRKDIFFTKSGFNSQDLIYAQTGYLVAAYELAQRCEFDVNFIVDNFTVISQSLVYALDFSPSLTTYTEKVRNELIAFMNILKNWMFLIRDVGATIQFLDTVSHDNFLVRVNAQPYALFLQAIACNPERCDQVIDWLLTKNPNDQNANSEVPKQRVYEETSTFKRAIQSVANSFKALFGSKTRHVDVVELSANPDNQTSEQAIERSVGEHLERATYSQINKQLVNNATELAYLYYRKLYYKNKEPYLAIVTNIPNRVLNFLDSLGFNRKNLTRNITYRVCGLNVGRQLMLNLSLLNASERKQLFAFCEKNYRNNSFSYLQRKGFKQWATVFFSEYHVRHKNYIFYRSKGERETLPYLQHITSLLGKTAPQANANEVKLVNSYELGYEIEDLASYELTEEQKQTYVLPFVHTEKELYDPNEDLYTQLKEKATALAEKANYDAHGNALATSSKVESLDTFNQDATAAKQEASDNKPEASDIKPEATATKTEETAAPEPTSAPTQETEPTTQAQIEAVENELQAQETEEQEEQANLATAEQEQADDSQTPTEESEEVTITPEQHQLNQMLEQLTEDTGTSNLEPENLHENMSPEALTSDNTEQVPEANLVPETIALRDIFAPHRIRGLNPGDYSSDYRPLAVEDLGTDPEDHNLTHSINYYTKFVGLNSIIIPLSEVLDRKNFSMRLLPPRFPLMDIIVVVDTLCTEFNLSSLTSFPNLRMLFTDVTTYKYWLDYIKYYAGVKDEQVRYDLYLHRYDHWRLLTRSFVLVRNNKH
ncbi:hypothetical protein CJP74_00620 [Psittacicella melopsittaci]|uniref:Glycosyltransferase 2-like domain-containing protein n=1 Tax=Psittacicella melopsittaci TaxID=2028576 RepID=A0A3A1Y9R9_9GAMM|nr:glycosyltransferase family 2 protein [Psittacicella melopsittaci]RIY33960.1 hypothetical protein CJP74_00620 [Psittacicella melopsittaci]